MICHYLVKFGGHRYCRSGGMFLVLSRDQAKPRD